ncbi:FAD:protein FMN transferase [bacterium]|nr:FAD:protein FMN transferase [bacterium]MBU1994016.1 FAD:protein FMN transferase [bacterium]
MGTFISISLDEKDIHSIEEGFGIFNDVELSLSSYNPNAQIYQLNKNKTTKINRYTYEALQLCEKYYKQSDGYFDITIGSITKDLYRFGEDEKVPHAKELQDAYLNFKAIHFNKKEASIGKNISLDFGGMGKGFGVDKVSAYLKHKEVKQAIISASGDIRCLGRCKIDVQNPLGEGILLSFETLGKEMGISTSGNYNRYVKSTKHNHLINPKSKISQDKFLSITLISSLPSSDLDAYATAASVMPSQKAYAFLESMDLGYIVMQSDGALKLSANISFYTKNLIMNNTLKE